MCPTERAALSPSPHLALVNSLLEIAKTFEGDKQLLKRVFNEDEMSDFNLLGKMAAYTFAITEAQSVRLRVEKDYAYNDTLFRRLVLFLETEMILNGSKVPFYQRGTPELGIMRAYDAEGIEAIASAASGDAWKNVVAAGRW